MFELERQFKSESTTRIVASESQKSTLEQRQRDVYETHRHRVFAVGYYMTSNELEAESVLAETFVTAFETHKEPDALGVDRAMVGAIERRVSLDAVEAARPDQAVSLEKASTRRTDMEEALTELPGSERIIFLLRDVEGYSTQKVAKVLELTEAEVQRTLFSARIRMRNALALAQSKAQACRVAQTDNASADDLQPA